MTITQTVEIPADRRITVEVPSYIPAGETARFEINWFPVNNEAKPLVEANSSLSEDKAVKNIINRKKLDEMVKNSKVLKELTGILSGLEDADLDEIRYKALAEKHLK